MDVDVLSTPVAKRSVSDCVSALRRLGMNSDGPNLRAVASLPEEEARRLLAVGVRTLPSSHELRALASWSRRVWRPAVRVHALRALVRTPTALQHLSPRAQDMLFAVFRTVNPSNREVCASFFGVLLLAEDPWLIDTGGEGEDGDALRAAEAFQRLYDVRHEYLGNLEPGNPDLLNRESDVLRRHLGQTPPHVRVASTGSALKAPRLDSKKSNEPSATSNASAMHGVVQVQVPTDNDEQSTGRGYATHLEKRVSELKNEVDKLKAKLKDNEKRTKHLQTLFDFMAKVLLDELQIATAIPHVVSTNSSREKPAGEASNSNATCSGKQAKDEPADGHGISQKVENRMEQRIRLLERFREIVEASPWEAFGNSNGSNDSESAGAALRHGTNSTGSLPVAVFRNGSWVNR